MTASECELATSTQRGEQGAKNIWYGFSYVYTAMGGARESGGGTGYDTPQKARDAFIKELHRMNWKPPRWWQWWRWDDYPRAWPERNAL